MPQDGSTNWNLPLRYDVTPDESDDADDDADEMVQDYVADLPLEAPVVEDRVANLPQEAHVVEDHVANLQQECAICVTNARGMAFLCGHTDESELTSEANASLYSLRIRQRISAHLLMLGQFWLHVAKHCKASSRILSTAKIFAASHASFGSKVEIASPSVNFFMA
nr:hypothetical protein CFP56_58577 [Quercus suber]